MKRQIVGLKTQVGLSGKGRHDILTKWLTYYKEMPTSNINRDEIDLSNSIYRSLLQGNAPICHNSMVGSELSSV
jgi:hypothetical protein